MITISKNGLKEHYEHVQRIRKEHGQIPLKAVYEIGNRTLREAKILSTTRVRRISGTYNRSINMQVLKDGNNDVAVIGSHVEYAPYLEYGTNRGIKPRWVLRDAIFNLANKHVPIIMKYLQKPVK